MSAVSMWRTACSFILIVLASVRSENYTAVKTHGDHWITINITCSGEYNTVLDLSPNSSSFMHKNKTEDFFLIYNNLRENTAQLSSVDIGKDGFHHQKRRELPSDIPGNKVLHSSLSSTSKLKAINVTDSEPLLTDTLRPGPATESSGKEKLEEEEKNIRQSSEVVLKNSLNISNTAEDDSLVELKFTSNSHASGNVTYLDERLGSAKEVRLFVSQCEEIAIGQSSVDKEVRQITMSTEGRLYLQSGWAESADNLHKIRMAAAGGLTTEMNCSQWPSGVKELDLSYTQLLSLDIRACPSLFSLHSLVAVGSKLSSISLCIPSLVILDISWNDLQEINIQSEDLCRGKMASVDSLTAANNNIYYWSSCEWPALKTLDLSRNDILTVDLGTCPPHLLSNLNVAFNQIQKAPPELSRKITSVNFSHNRLDSLPKFNPSVQEADFSHNLIGSFGHATFKRAHKLLILDMSHNRISSIKSRDLFGLRELRQLDLSYNALSHVAPDALKPLLRLQLLRIHHNSLAQLDARTLASLSPTVRTELHHNPWHCSCQLLVGLVQATNSHCHPHCRKHEIYCQEHKKKVSASDVLRKCIRAIQDITEHKPHDEGSDEDISEETAADRKRQGDGGSGHSSYQTTFVIPVILVLVFLVIGSVLAYRLYQKRKKICKRYFQHFDCCNCADPPQPATSPNTLENRDSESDSETEL